MRELTDHKINGLNDKIQVTVLDEPGPGGACHKYRACVPMIDPVELYPSENSRRSRTYCDINFQNGPIGEVGFNGISNEALLVVLIDRMDGFQSGQFACEENERALLCLKEALGWMQKRTRDRMARGVEGTSQK